MFGKEALATREQQWARFHEWEEAYRRRRPHDLDTDWAWYQEVWEMARQTGAILHARAFDMKKIARIRAMRARLARLPWPS
jgi:hypothetical protein